MTTRPSPAQTFILIALILAALSYGRAPRWALALSIAHDSASLELAGAHMRLAFAIGQDCSKMNSSLTVRL